MLYEIKCGAQRDIYRPHYKYTCLPSPILSTPFISLLGGMFVILTTPSVVIVFFWSFGKKKKKAPTNL